MQYIPLFLTLQALVFGIAALIHGGVLVRGYEHQQAMIAESVIAAVLVLGLIAGALAPARRRAFALAAQAFALLGTCVGLVTIAIGVGPQSVFDLTLHAIMIVLLIAGLIVVARGRRPIVVP